MKNKFLIYFSSFLIFFAASIFITFPLLFHIGSLATGIGDELVMAWIHNWVIHAVLTNPLSLFEANLYFPHQHTLAFAESLISTSILAIPIQKFVGEPIAVVNFTLISSIVLLGFSIFCLCYYLSKNYFASLLAGVLVIFSPAVLDFATHLQILASQFMVFSLLFFLIFIKTEKSKYLLYSLLFFLFQAYNSFMPAYFTVISMGIIFIYHFFSNKKRAKKIITKKNFLIVVIAVILVFPVIYPYYQVSAKFNYKRDIRDAIHLALQPEDLLYGSVHTRLRPFLLGLPFNQLSQNSEFKSGYPGFIFSLLALFSSIYVLQKFKKKIIPLNSFFTISLTGLVLSLGPVLHLGRQTVHKPFLIPLPYAVAYYILPGFAGFRNSARFEMLFIIAMAVVIGLVIDRILKNLGRTKKILIYIILFAGILIEFNFPMHFEKVEQRKDFPQVDHWLARTREDAVIIQMPISSWGWQFTQNEIFREYYSTIHFRKMVNGYTSFSPPPWMELVDLLHKEFPNKRTLEKLERLGVTYIIVDKDLYDRGVKIKSEKFSGDTVISALEKSSEVKLIKQLQNNYVFAFEK